MFSGLVDMVHVKKDSSYDWVYVWSVVSGDASKTIRSSAL